MSRSARKGIYSRSRRSEFGNVFFTLFGAVAIVGVLGAGIMATMRGPLSTMVEVNRREQAKAELRVAASLVLVNSDDASLEVGCAGEVAGDGYTEGPDPTGAGPTGGGILPAVGAAQNDPWGNAYGYCAWNHGPNAVPADIAFCGNVRAGNTSTNNIAIAIMSAGPDGVFQTSCADDGVGDDYIAPDGGGGDDIVVSMTYDQAIAAGGGLWTPVGPTGASIARDLAITGNTAVTGALDITGSGSFTDVLNLTGASAQLQLGQRSMVLPNQVQLPTCNAANDGLIRLSSSAGYRVQVCQNGPGWVASGSSWDTVTGGINYSAGNVGIGVALPNDALDVSGTAQITGAAALDSTATIGGVLTVNATSALNDNVTITGDTADGSTDALTINDSGPSVIFTVDSDGNTDAQGNVNTAGSYMIDGNVVLANGDVATNVLLGPTATSSTADNYMNLGQVIQSDLIARAPNTNPVVAIGYTAGYDFVANPDSLNDELEVRGSADISDDLNVTDALTVGGLSDFANNVTITGDTNDGSTDPLTILDSDSTPVLTINSDGDVAATDISAVNLTVTTRVTTDQLYVNDTDNFVPGTCAAGSFNRWSGSSWVCAADTGGAGSGTQDFEDVLTNDDDANGQNAVGLGAVAIGAGSAAAGFELDVTGEITASGLAIGSTTFSAGTQTLEVDITGDIGADNFCDSAGNNCFTASSVANASQDRIEDTGDQNTYIDVDTADDDSLNTISMFTAGTERINIGATGTVAITNAATVGGTLDVTDDLTVDTTTLFVDASANNVGIGTITPNASAVLDMTSTAAGMLAPRMAIAQRDVIGTPATGLLVFATDAGDAGVFQFYDGSAWIDVGGGGADIGQIWSEDGTNDYIEYDDTLGGVRIGRVSGQPAPETDWTLDVAGSIVYTSKGVAIGGSTLSAGVQTLEVDITGDIGATNYCDADGNNCFTAASVAGGSAGLWTAGTGDDIYYNSGTPQVGIGTASPDDALDVVGTAEITGNTVLGADLDVTGNTVLSGTLGINTATPQTQLEVDGTIRMGYGGENCDASREGAIHYDSAADTFYVCQTAGSWSVLATGTPSAAAPDRGIQFNSGGSFAAESTFVYTSTGRLGVGTATPGYELDVTGSGLFTGGVGIGTTPGTTGLRIQSAPADDNTVTINSLAVSGTSAAGIGLVNSASLVGNLTTLDGVNITGSISGVAGTVTDLSGYRSDYGLISRPVTNLYNFYAGDSMAVVGSGSIGTAYGLYIEDIDNAATNYAIYSEGGDSYFGGGVGLGVTAPNTRLDVDGTIRMAYGGETCDASREGAIHFDSAADRFYVCQDASEGWIQIATNNATASAPDRGIQFNSGGNFAAETTFVYTSTGNLGIGTATPIAGLDVDTADALVLPRGADADRPTGADGMIRFNSENDTYEVYSTTAADWIAIVTGGAISGDNVAGSDGQLQFNSSGTHGADSGLSYNATTDTLTLGTALHVGDYIHITGQAGNAPTFATLGQLDDVNVAGPSDGDLLYYNNASGDWEALDPSSITSAGLWTAGAGDIIYYNSGTPNVGIGVTNPVQIVEIREDQDAQTLLSVSNMDAGASASAGFTAASDAGYVALTQQSLANGGGSAVISNTAAGLALISGHATNGGVSFYTGATPDLRMLIDQNGDIAIGTPTANTKLDVNGTIKMAYGGEVCDANREGAIHYDSGADRFFVCQTAAEGWIQIATNNATASAPDRGIQFNSGGSFAADANFTYTSAGNVGIGISTPQTALDVDGTIKMAYGGEDCDASREGSIHYDSGANTFYFCATAGSWEAITLGSGTLAALSDTNITGPGDGNVLYYSGGGWINNALLINDLGDAAYETNQFNMFLGHEGGSFGANNTNNVAVGPLALDALNNDATAGWGDNNAAFGSSALTANTTGSDNTAVGHQALAGNTTGARNTVMGMEAGLTNSIGIENTFIGQYSGHANDTGNYNTLIGTQAGSSLDSHDNTYVGAWAGQATSSGGENTAIGRGSLEKNETGSQNVTLGYRAGYGADGVSNISNNVLLGYQAANGILTGADSNVIIGHSTAATLTTGASNILIGQAVDVLGATTSNYLNIGNTLMGDMATGDIEIAGTAALTVPRGDTSERPAGVDGMIRYNSQTDKFEGYQAGIWSDIITSGASASAPDRGIQFNSGGNFAAESTFTYTSVGNLGIGTATPVQPLHVAGDGYIEDSLGIGIGPGVGNNRLMVSSNFDVNAFFIANSTAYNAAIYLSQGAGNHAGGLRGTATARDVELWSEVGDINFLPVTGRVGIGTTTPLAGLDINTTDAIVLPRGDDSERPAGVDGMIRFNSEGDAYEVYSTTAAGWVEIVSAGAVAGGGLWTDNTTHISYNSAHFINSGQSLPATLDDDGARMFFYPDKAAFRGGLISGGDTAWQDANIANYSFAFGDRTQASGQSSVALGENTTASALNSTAMGQTTTASGVASTAMGWLTAASGSGSTALGASTQASGIYSTALGKSVVAGNGVAASGLGDGSIAFGLIDNAVTITTPSQVTGIQSMGVFMGDQDGLVLSTDNQVSFLGGSMVIDPTVPATNLVADTALEVEGTIKMAYGGEACDASREGAIHFDSGADRFYVCQSAAEGWIQIATNNATASAPDRGIQFNSGGSFAADANFTYTSAGNVGIGISTPQTALDVDGTIKMAYGGEDCDASREGSIHYDSGANTFYFCATAGSWEAITLGSGTLAALSDTNITGPGDGNVLYYSGGGWINNALLINDLGDAYTDYSTDFNIYMGDSAGNIVSPGQYNVAIGQNTLNNMDGTCAVADECDNNVAIGYNALTDLTLGSDNISIGALSGAVLTTGASNILIGLRAGNDLTTTSENTFIGNRAGTNSSGASAIDNTYIGSFSGANNDGGYNVFVGQDTGYQSTGVDASVFIGVDAAKENVTGDDNTIIGYSAGQGTSTISNYSDNVFIGNLSGLLAQTAASNNVFIGSETGDTVTAGASNILIGYNVDTPLATTSNYLNIGNTLMGDMATGDIEIAGTAALTVPRGDTSERPAGVDGMIRYNSQTDKFEGYQAGIWSDIITSGASASAPDRGIQFNSGGSFAADANFTYTSAGNVGIGISTPQTALDVDGTIKMAYGGEDCDASREGSIHYDSGANTFYFCATAGSWEAITLGSGTLAALSDTNITGPGDGNVLYYSGGGWINNALLINDLGDAYTDYSTDFNIYMGDSAGNIVSPGQYNVAIGQNTLNNMDGTCAVADECDNNVAIGYNALTDLTLGSDNISIGALSGAVLTTGASNILIGLRAGNDLTTTSENTFIGNRAGTNSSGASAIDNTYIGSFSGANNDGGYNVFVGQDTGYQSTGVDASVFIGVDAAKENVTGDDNTIIGYSAGQGTSTISNYSDNVFIGNLSGLLAQTAASNNVFIGSETGDTVTAGASNILIGYNVDTPLATTSNYLNIGNTLMGDMATGDIEIAGTAALTVPRGDTSERPAGVDGMIRYNSQTDKFEGYQAGIWSDIITSGASASAPDRGIQFNSGGNFSADANFTYTSVGDLIVGSPQIDDTGTGSEDSRMYFDVSNSAFRAGSVATGQWDFTSTGQYSAAFGRNTVASNSYSFAAGEGSEASGSRSFAVGEYTTADGYGSIAMGIGSIAMGYGATALGSSSAIGDGSTASGYTDVSGQTASGFGYEIAVGDGVYGSGAGDYSMGFGIGNSGGVPSTWPRITGQESLGIFMGDQSNVNFTPSRTMGVFGGSMVIDPSIPATNLLADTALEIEGTIKMAYGGEACDASREGSIHYDSGANTFYFCATAGSWEAITLGSGTLAALSDTNITGPTNGNVLYYSGSEWINNTLLIDDLTDAYADYAGPDNLIMGRTTAAALTAGAQFNVFIGEGAGATSANSTATTDANTALGYSALGALTTGDDNTAVGHQALAGNTTGARNTVMGMEAGLTNSIGIENTFIGQYSGHANDTGNYNTLIGTQAGSSLDSHDNTYVGAWAGQATSSGGENTAIGRGSLEKNETGSQNVTLGYRAGYGADGVSNISNNVLLGYQAANGILTGADSNVIIGHSTAATLTTGASNILIGQAVDVLGATTSNYLNIGNTLMGDMATGDIEIAGTAALTVPRGDTSERPAGVDGMIRYNSQTDKFEGYQAGIWSDIITSGASASAPDRGIQFNSGGNFSADANFTYTSVGDLIVGSPQIDDTGTGSEDSRMYFDVSNSAFRAGSVATGQWDFTSTGQYSAAFGRNTVASNSYSFAAGEGSEASGSRSFAVGEYTTADGYGSIAMGIGSIAMGYGATALGSSSAIGDGSTASGYTDVSGQTASGFGYEIAVGDGVYGSGAGDYSMGFGIGNSGGVPSTWPRITGQESLGIFMGDQSNVNFTPSRTMGVFGGSMVIDPSIPATNLLADTALEIEGTIKMAYGGEACDASREGSIHYDSGANTFYFCATAGSWEAITLGSGTLAALSDTNITGPTNGNVLYYSGSEWINNTLLIDDLTDAYADYAGPDNLIMGRTTAAALTAGAQFNVFIGEGAGATSANSTATTDANTALGYSALGALTTGDDNTAVGHQALAGNTTGARNTVMGMEAGLTNSIGIENTFIGQYSGHANDTGNYNTLIGTQAGSSLDSHDNTYVGAWAGQATSSGGENTAIGRGSLEKNETGSQNVTLGYRAGYGADGVSNISNNVLLGYQAANGILTGADSNVIIGHSTAATLTTGASNILIGQAVDVLGATTSNYLNIGNTLMGDMATGDIEIAGTAALTVPRGDTSERPAGVDGMIRYNSQTDKFEGYQAGIWSDIITSGASAAAPDRGIQFNSGGSFAADANFTYTSAGNVGVGISTPQTALDVDGTIKMAYGGEDCDASREGAIHYDSSADEFYVCRTAGSWDSLPLPGGGLWTDNTTHISYQSAHFLNAGQTIDTASLNGGVGTAFIWDADNGSLRGGSAAGTQWDDANIGPGSLAFGGNAIASADYSVALGWGTWADQWGAVATGDTSFATGSTAVAMGSNVEANGVESIAFGRSVIADGANSMAIGLGTTGGAKPTVSGDSSMGIFLGDQGNVGLTADSLFAVMGANGYGFNTVTPQAFVEFSSTGSILLPRGDTSQRDLSPVNGMIRYNSQTDKFEGYQASMWSDIITSGASASAPDRGIQFNSGGSFAADANFTYSSAGHLGIFGASADSVGLLSLENQTSDGELIMGYNVSGNKIVKIGQNGSDHGLIKVYDTDDTRDIAMYFNNGDAIVALENNITSGDSDAVILLDANGTGESRVNFNIDDTTMWEIIVGDQNNDNMTIYDTSGDGVITFTSANNVGINNTAPDVELDVTGDIEYTGTITDVSDARLKDNIEPLNKYGSLLDRINQIETVSFVMKDDEKKRTEFGVIAQQLENIFPELVHTAKDEIGTKSVNYVGLIAPMIEATKELKAENDNLKSELAAMEVEKENIHEAVASLQQQVDLLNKAAGDKVGKASMIPTSQGLLYILLGMLGTLCIVLVVTRKAATNNNNAD